MPTASPMADPPLARSPAAHQRRPRHQHGPHDVQDRLVTQPFEAAKDRARVVGEHVGHRRDAQDDDQRPGSPGPESWAAIAAATGTAHGQAAHAEPDRGDLAAPAPIPRQASGSSRHSRRHPQPSRTARSASARTGTRRIRPPEDTRGDQDQREPAALLHRHRDRAVDDVRGGGSVARRQEAAPAWSSVHGRSGRAAGVGPEAQKVKSFEEIPRGAIGRSARSPPR